jgi:hypothetical protein
MHINESEQHIWVIIPCDEDNHSSGLCERQGLQVIVGAGGGDLVFSTKWVKKFSDFEMY